MSNDQYLGNPLLKKANTPIEFTKDQIEQFIKCKKDPVYFAKNYIKSVFFLDCFTTIPWGLIERAQEKYNQGDDYANRDDIKMLRIIRL